MRFFSNKIYVNGASKNFNDIIGDVAGGMKKQASTDASIKEEPIVKQAKEAITGAQANKLPKNLVKAIKAKEDKQGKGSGKKGNNPFANKKKSSVDGEEVKIASISAGNDGAVEIEFVPVEAKFAEIEISDDGQVKVAKWGEAAKSESGEAGKDGNQDGDKKGEAMSAEGGYESGMTAESGEGCEACGTTMASSSDFVKVANLTDKQKSAFRSYWQNIWPKEFIDAVLDKDQ